MSRFVSVVLSVWMSLSALGAGKPFSIVERQGLRFVSIPSGQFRMGTGPGAKEALVAAGWWSRFLECEMPAHMVVVQRPFLMGLTEITQDEWEQVLGKKKPNTAFKGGQLPVENVSWSEVQRFLAKLNEPGKNRFRLPTEAEWEYCCRAGGWGLYTIGSDGRSVPAASVTDYGWFKSNAAGATHPVATREPNAWGLYDMLGNVWEWCQDTYDRDAYATRGPRVIDPLTQISYPERVIRGGSWYLPLSFQRAAVRSACRVDSSSPYLGLRVVCEIEPEPSE